MKKIWCLYSVENNYDQPPNNLVAWWTNKPNLEQVAECLGTNMQNGNDIAVLATVGVWKGENTRYGGTDYRLEQASEGYQGD